jgi:hypothetical protein
MPRTELIRASEPVVLTPALARAKASWERIREGRSFFAGQVINSPTGVAETFERNDALPPAMTG